MAIPAFGFADTLRNPLKQASADASDAAKMFHVDYKAGETIIKSVTIQIPEDSNSALLSAEAFPTEEELANVIGPENQIIGWIDISDLDLEDPALSDANSVAISARAQDDAAVYTQEELMRVEMSDDKVFAIVVVAPESAATATDATQSAKLADADTATTDTSQPAKSAASAKSDATQSAEAGDTTDSAQPAKTDAADGATQSSKTTDADTATTDTSQPAKSAASAKSDATQSAEAGGTTDSAQPVKTDAADGAKQSSKPTDADTATTDTSQPAKSAASAMSDATQSAEAGDTTVPAQSEKAGDTNSPNSAPSSPTTAPTSTPTKSAPTKSIATQVQSLLTSQPESQSALSITTLAAPLVAPLALPASKPSNILAGAKLSSPDKTASSYDASCYPLDSEPGAVQMAKSAVWTDKAKGEAEIQFNLWGNNVAQDAGDVIILFESHFATAQSQGYSICPYDGATLPSNAKWQFSNLNGNTRTAQIVNAPGHVHTVTQTYHGSNMMADGNGLTSSLNWSPFLPTLNMRMSAHKGVANRYIDDITGAGGKVAVITYGTGVIANTGFTTSQNAHNTVMNADYNTAASTNHNFVPPLQAADKLIRSRANQSRPVTILWITDGYPTGDLDAYRSVVEYMQSWDYYYDTHGAQLTFDVFGIYVMDNLGKYGVSCIWDIATDGSQGHQTFDNGNIIYNNHTRIFKQYASPSTNQLVSAIDSLAARLTGGAGGTGGTGSALPAGKNAKITDVVSDDFQIVSVDTHGIGTATVNGQTVTWTVGDIPADPGAVLTIHVKLKDNYTTKTEFATNKGNAELSYKNFDNKDCKQYVDSPTLTRDRIKPTYPTDFYKTLPDSQNSVIAKSDTGKPVNYEISFKLPADLGGYTSIKVQDIIPAGMDINLADVKVTANGTALSLPAGALTKTPASGSGSSATKATIQLFIEKNAVSADFWNALAGKTIGIQLQSTFTGTPAVGSTYTNLAKLFVNDDNVGTDDDTTITIGELNSPKTFVKQVSVDGGLHYVDNANITSADTVLTYRIAVTFPDNMNGYNKVAIEDDLPDSLLYQQNSGKILINGTQAGAADGAFAVNASTNSVTYTFADGYDLKSLAGKTVEFVLNAKIDATMLAANGSTTITNDAKLILNNGNDDQTVTTKPAIVVPKLPEDFNKTLAGGQNATILVSDISKPVGYEIRFKLPTDMKGYESIKVTDAIPTGMDINLADVKVTANGTALSLPSGALTKTPASGSGSSATKATIQLSIDKNVVSAAFWNALAGKTIVISLQSTFTGTPAVGSTFTNTAKIFVNGDQIGEEDNDTTITIGEDLKPQLPADFNKTLADGQNATIASSDIGKPIGYKISFKLPTDMKGYSSIKVQDVLPTGMDVNLADVKVTINGTAFAIPAGALTKTPASGSGASATKATINLLIEKNAIPATYWNALAGKSIVINLQATFTGAPAAGESFTNVAKIFVNGDNAGEDGDTTITIDNPKAELPSGFKKTLANGQDATIALNETNQPIDYEISFKLPANLNGYKTLKITDTLPAGMDAALSDVKITADGAAFPLPSGLLTKASNTITLQVDKASIPANIWNALPGKTIVMHVSATFTSTANPKIGDVFTNTARIFLNGEKVGEDEQPIIIGIAAGPTDLLKSVSTDGGKTFNADAVITSLDTPLIYRVNVTFPADMSGYDSVAIADELPASLVYVTGSGKVVVDGKTPAATDGSLSFDTAKNTLTYTFADNYDLKKLAGKSAQLYLDAKINEKAIANGATVIKNVGHLILNEAENPAAPTNFKKVVAAGQSTSISDITKPVSYSISATMPTDMKGYK
ncbi:MAG: isopeptide-forming domain-containing fimbrial protein, partial [Clostridiales Family XIII bacterium]|nr:isopeptide-forming domain-containing fimbrial protein [Clostridiales Family XIII bacterium]